MGRCFIDLLLGTPVQCSSFIASYRWLSHCCQARFSPVIYLWRLPCCCWQLSCPKIIGSRNEIEIMKFFWGDSPKIHCLLRINNMPKGVGGVGIESQKVQRSQFGLFFLLTALLKLWGHFGKWMTLCIVVCVNLLSSLLSTHSLNSSQLHRQSC